MTKPRIVKIRVAVVVTADGSYNAVGYGSPIDSKSQPSEKEIMGTCLDGVWGDQGEKRYWLTTELEIPETTEIILTAADVKEVE